MKLYGIYFSPFVRKVALVAAEKGIEYERGVGGPGNLSEEFLAASPFKKMPALVDGDYSLADSTAICVYLDAKYPEPALLPADPQARGRAMWFEEVCDSILFPAAGPMVFNRFVVPKFRGVPGDEEAALKAEEATAPILDWLEAQAPSAGWFLGDGFSLADIAVASSLRTLMYVGSGADATRHPTLAAWYARVCERPAWQKIAAGEAAGL